MTPDSPIRRRRHFPEFQSQLVAAARKPGVSVAGIALAHGINANLLRRGDEGCARRIRTACPRAGAHRGHTATRSA